MFSVVVPVSEKPGSCPPLLPGTVGICLELCTGDFSCPGISKCCSNGCGHVCKEPTCKPANLYKSVFSFLPSIYQNKDRKDRHTPRHCETNKTEKHTKTMSLCILFCLKLRWIFFFSVFTKNCVVKLLASIL